MPGLVRIGLVLLVGATLGACAGNSRNYSTTSSAAGATAAPPPSTYQPAAYPGGPNGANNPAVSFDSAGSSRQSIDAAADNYCAAQGKTAAFVGRNGTRLAYDCIPANARAAAPAAKNYGNGANNPAVSYDATLYDRQTLEAQADAYCAAQGKSAAFSGRTGSRVNYDCVLNSDAAPALAAAPAYAPTVPSVTYRLTGNNGQAIAADAATYCSSQGRIAQFRNQDGTFVTYDCIIDPSQPFRTASYSTSTTSYVPAPAAPTITYELASDGRSTLDAPAIRYCGMLGKSPVLRSQDGRRVTYECQ